MCNQNTADKIILANFNLKYPTVQKVLTRILEGASVKDIAIELQMKEQSIRNLKTRYKEFIYAE